MNSVLTQVQEDVLVVTNNRPEVRNAVDADTARAFVNAFRAFGTDSSLRVRSVVVLRAVVATYGRRDTE